MTEGGEQMTAISEPRTASVIPSEGGEKQIAPVEMTGAWSRSQLAVRGSLLATLLLACGDGNPQPAVVIDTLPGGIVRTITHSPPGSAPAVPWQLVEEQVIEASAGSLLETGEVSQVVLADNGDLWVVEGRIGDKRVLRYPAGTDHGSIVAVSGEGPGEVQSPVVSALADSMVVTDGDRLLVFDLDGRLRNQWRLPRTQVAAIDRHGRTWYQVRRTDPGQSRSDPTTLMQWLRYPADGGLPDSIPLPVAVAPQFWESAELGAVFYIPFTAGTVRSITPDGMVIYGRTDRDEFIVTGNGLDTVRIFGRSGATATAVPDEERRTFFERRSKSIPGFDKTAKLEDIPTHLPLWTAIKLDGDGNLWVSRERGADGAGQSTFDIYDPAGYYLGELVLPWPVQTLSLASDRLVVTSLDDDDLPVIRVYRLVR